MIVFKDALAKAKEIMSEIDTCIEYEKGYVFNCKKYEYEIGGEHAPVVILKSNGKAISMIDFISIDDSDEIRESDC